MQSIDRGQLVLHKTSGPGRVVVASAETVEVEFHDGRRESFRRTYAEEVLTPCPREGFCARFLVDREGVSNRQSHSYY